MGLNLVEASIADLQHALSTGSITAVELLAKYLLRIFTYDCRGPCLNAIPILNPDAFDEAAASDARRRAGKPLGPLDGIPYTTKDSLKYKGMTCASGSPALKNFVANEDSFVNGQLRKGGAICIGRTNTPPMMASGMHRGLHGRAESPYNLEYLTAAFSSGSSNGAATSTAASFAAFGLGSETVSSGRSPASNNGLVAYTPSRNVISPRGCWPLYPTCDVLVPMTRTVKDMLALLDVLVVEDERTDEQFWREQTLVDVPPVQRPQSFLGILPDARDSIRGKKIAVPKMYIGEQDPKAKPTVVSQDVIELWHQARKDLEVLGATVLETDFPLVTNYEDDSVSGHTNNVAGFKTDWNGKERGELVAYLWDDFLKSSADPNYPGLASVDGSEMFPRPEGYIPDRYMELKNFMDYPRLVEIARTRNGKSIWDVDGINEALPALEAQRKRDFEDWMAKQGIDFVVFPANGDVGRADVDTNDESAKHALQNGVKYSNGNRAIRHMGVPTVSVTMGLMETSGMPVNLTFAAGHGRDGELLRFAYVFEQQTRRRVEPPITPTLPSDEIELETKDRDTKPNGSSSPPELDVTSAQKISDKMIKVEGTVNDHGAASTRIEAFVDGKQPGNPSRPRDGTWSVEANFTPFELQKALYGGVGQVVGNINVVILARGPGGVTGKLVRIDQKGPVQRSE